MNFVDAGKQPTMDWLLQDNKEENQTQVHDMGQPLQDKEDQMEKRIYTSFTKSHRRSKKHKQYDGLLNYISNPKFIESYLCFEQTLQNWSSNPLTFGNQDVSGPKKISQARVCGLVANLMQNIVARSFFRYFHLSSLPECLSIISDEWLTGGWWEVILLMLLIVQKTLYRDHFPNDIPHDTFPFIDDNDENVFDQIIHIWCSDLRKGKGGWRNISRFFPSLPPSVTNHKQVDKTKEDINEKCIFSFSPQQSQERRPKDQKEEPRCLGEASQGFLGRSPINNFFCDWSYML